MHDETDEMHHEDIEIIRKVLEEIPSRIDFQSANE